MANTRTKKQKALFEESFLKNKVSSNFIENVKISSEKSLTQRGLNLFEKMVEKHSRWKLTLLKNLDKIFPDNSFIRLDRVDEDLLILRVPHPAVAAELRFSHRNLVEKINGFLDRPRIKRIVYSVGSVSGPHRTF